MSKDCVRIVDVRERAVPLSRYADATVRSGGLTTSVVAIESNVTRSGKRVTGYGFSSMGRFAQSGLLRERFIPRLLGCDPTMLLDRSGQNIDPFRAWQAMMAGEKAGGHGERCVAVGTLDMALWDLAAKIAGVPLYEYLSSLVGLAPSRTVRVYASGGYLHPADDLLKLKDEVRAAVELGFENFKMKIGQETLENDSRRIEAAASVLSDARRLAVDAMNAYDAPRARSAAQTLQRYDLWWFEDFCDPLDFELQAEVADMYPGPIAAGEALFSSAEAKLLAAHGGLRKDRDILLFDPVHCYGIPGYLEIIRVMLDRGWKRESFWPHGGHIYCLHLVSALGLGGAEVNPFSFAPFGGLPDGTTVDRGRVHVPQLPGIGFEGKADALALFESI
ncbi:MAG TPA: enolase C-terminal domain-like protein [Candidatus Baltobacteraceae bacterium]|nr:enolase C-terminal domain-like protein [Candidatus Baltobacteraceae bacterium]